MSSTTLPAVPTERSLEWVQRLIGIDTTSAVSNRPLIDLIAAELRRHGVEPVLVAMTRERSSTCWQRSLLLTEVLPAV